MKATGSKKRTPGLSNAGMRINARFTTAQVALMPEYQRQGTGRASKPPTLRRFVEKEYFEQNLELDVDALMKKAVECNDRKAKFELQCGKPRAHSSMVLLQHSVFGCAGNGVGSKEHMLHLVPAGQRADWDAQTVNVEEAFTELKALEAQRNAAILAAQGPRRRKGPETVSKIGFQVTCLGDRNLEFTLSKKTRQQVYWHQLGVVLQRKAANDGGTTLHVFEPDASVPADTVTPLIYDIGCQFGADTIIEYRGRQNSQAGDVNCGLYSAQFLIRMGGPTPLPPNTIFARHARTPTSPPHQKTFF